MSILNGLLDQLLNRNSSRGPAGQAELSSQPDQPLPFGYKTAWLAVRCEKPEWVISALEPFSRQPANWATGLARVDKKENCVFVSPCLEGWVLAVGIGVTHRDWDQIAKNFPEVQAFASQRVSDSYTWKKYEQGICRRYFCVNDGTPLFSEGELTEAEQALGLGETDRLPDEETVLDIAAAWGFDPRMEGKDYPPSCGWVCEME